MRYKNRGEYKMDNSKEEVRDKLRHIGVKVTPQRIAVYQALAELCHASVEEVIVKVASQHPTITIATVYNVLDCFAERGVITRLNTPKGKMYYDISTHDHHHIIADDGTIIDYENTELTNLINDYINSHPLKSFAIERISVQLIGNKNQ